MAIKTHALAAAPPRGRRHGERGAAALEFALVMPVLFLLLFGIIDYGLWFNDSLSVRQGVREGARLGVVKSFAAPGCTQTTDLAKLACRTRERVGALAGTTYVKVVVPEGWVRGKPLLVCGMVKVEGATGLVPLPAGRWVRSMTRMSIEADASPPTGGSSYEDPVSSVGGSWAWCV